jgi:hypothetical protein
MSILCAVCAYFSLMATDTLLQSGAASLTQKQSVLQAQAQKVMTWYQGNVVAIDSNSGMPTPPAISAQWGMKLLQTKRFNCNGQVQAHRYAVIIPGSGSANTTTLDPDTGALILVSSDMVQLIDGCQVEMSLFQQTQSNAVALAKALENYFKSQAIQNFGEVDRNYFTSPECGGWGGIDCAAANSPSLATVLEAPLGLGDTDCKDAWGGHLLFDNTSSTVQKSSLFIAQVGFTTPWGATNWITAIGEN